MNLPYKNVYKQFIMLCPVVIILLLIVQVVSINGFNSTLHTSYGEDEGSETYINIAGRGDSTSIWLKRGFMKDGKSVDLTGETIDGVLHNNSDDIVDNWSLRINIAGDCYINNAWCGTVEIHQFTGTKDEKVQTLDLRDYKLEEVELQNFYDGDLLIPLKEGDYIVYYPSAKDQEYPIEPHKELTMGMIFYYLDTLDISDHQLDYYYHRSITQGGLWYLIAALLIFWLISVVIYAVSLKIYEEAQRELRLKKSGISSMSEMYDTIYIVDVLKNEIVSIVKEEESELKRPEDIGANEQFKNLIEIDADDAFKDLVLDFVDLTTLGKRMEGKTSIICEYISRKRGWCRLRFFSMDSTSEQSRDQVVFTLQVIDAEKREMDAIEERLTRETSARKKEYKSLMRVLKEVIAPTELIIGLEENIINESSEDKIREYAKQLKKETLKHERTIKDILDFGISETEEFKGSKGMYSLKDMIEEAVYAFSPGEESENIEFTTDISRDIPEKLYGDGDHIKQVLWLMLLNASGRIESGKIKLSVFAKETEGAVHLLFSVKDIGPGEKKETGVIRLNLADSILQKMGSKLNSISDSKEENEEYFEIDQRVV